MDVRASAVLVVFLGTAISGVMTPGESQEELGHAATSVEVWHHVKRPADTAVPRDTLEASSYLEDGSVIDAIRRGKIDYPLIGSVPFLVEKSAEQVVRAAYTFDNGSLVKQAAPVAYDLVSAAGLLRGRLHFDPVGQGFTGYIHLADRQPEPLLGTMIHFEGLPADDGIVVTTSIDGPANPSVYREAEAERQAHAAESSRKGGYSDSGDDGIIPLGVLDLVFPEGIPGTADSDDVDVPTRTGSTGVDHLTVAVIRADASPIRPDTLASAVDMANKNMFESEASTRIELETFQLVADVFSSLCGNIQNQWIRDYYRNGQATSTLNDYGAIADVVAAANHHRFVYVLPNRDDCNDSETMAGATSCGLRYDSSSNEYSFHPTNWYSRTDAQRQSVTCYWVVQYGSSLTWPADHSQSFRVGSVFAHELLHTLHQPHVGTQIGYKEWICVGKWQQYNIMGENQCNRHDHFAIASSQASSVGQEITHASGFMPAPATRDALIRAIT